MSTGGSTPLLSLITRSGWILLQKPNDLIFLVLDYLLSSFDFSVSTISAGRRFLLKLWTLTFVLSPGITKYFSTPPITTTATNLVLEVSFIQLCQLYGTKSERTRNNLMVRHQAHKIMLQTNWTHLLSEVWARFARYFFTDDSAPVEFFLCSWLCSPTAATILLRRPW